MRLNKNGVGVIAASIIGTALALGSFLFLGASNGAAFSAESSGASKQDAPRADDLRTLRLDEAQAKSLSIVTVGERAFSPEREAVGVIDFNQYMTVQVSPPWTGRIVELLAREGDDVKKGQVLFMIESPDLVQAESALIAAAGVRNLTTRTLSRAKELVAVQGIAQKDYDQAVSDQQTAEGNFQAARDAVRIFGKTDAEIDRIVAERRIDARLPVRSSIRGRVTARNAAPGTLVQPGGTPAPYTVSDLSSKWMLANVTESDLPMLKLGQSVDVHMTAFPGRIFRGKITRIGTALDPATHRATVESEIADPKNELHPQMLAAFTLHTGDAANAVAVPETAVVREGDGTINVWVATDRRTFHPRTVTVGLRQDGYVQILDGLKPGELAVAEGGVFLSNMLFGAAPD